ncbi:MAG: hypothetical protein ACLGI5_07750 [Thermoleophilia bacterium]
MITAAASATAAYVCSKIWAPGTLGAAATTPVLIALLKEAYAKPADVVTRVVPVRGVVRSTAPGGDEPYDPVRPEPVQPAASVAGRVPQPGEVQGRSRGRAGHAWKMAVVTGLLGFLIAAVIITVPEFITGSSAAGGDRQTTFFGGDSGSSDSEESQDETTTTAPDDTEGLPPAGTVTVPPAQTTTVPPAQTTTVPPAGTEPVLPEEPEPGTEPQQPLP